MRVNEQTAVLGPRTVLVPYRKEHVPQYHLWMSDHQLRLSTASDLLSVDQEYEMCERWALDDDKLTFIIFERNPISGSSPDLVYLNRSDSDLQTYLLGEMIGDVNLFLSPDESKEEEEGNESKREETKNGEVKKPQKGELEIMIASIHHRKRGLATEALQLFLSYIQIISTSTTDLPNSLNTHRFSPSSTISFFFVKISFDNRISQLLFQKLGFVQVSSNLVFEEFEFRLSNSESSMNSSHFSVHPLLDSSILPKENDYPLVSVYESHWVNRSSMRIGLAHFPPTSDR
ncbi:hypothetical protein Pst134EA_013518 [Puccinia striiformis f. sp. tritici]|uniref:hypothetical protein n=1 Tax=Puccinia striiformis f. sp. tritici TaxID=168172 RepID=UPI002007D907|nr:hypothetical protein Pst134EA_013518 [Puccinia striiformis f. sp. tritici]KAH9465634.1 hypothetical protein Pst134EA_013518 [Puccinia striiformis f. sp. tritici]